MGVGMGLGCNQGSQGSPPGVGEGTGCRSPIGKAFASMTAVNPMVPNRKVIARNLMNRFFIPSSFVGLERHRFTSACGGHVLGRFPIGLLSDPSHEPGQKAPKRIFVGKILFGAGAARQA